MTDYHNVVMKIAESITSSDQLLKFMTQFGLSDDVQLQDRFMQLRWSEISEMEVTDRPLSPSTLLQGDENMDGEITDQELVEAEKNHNQYV